MSSSILGSSFLLHDVYIESIGTSVGKLESEGPLGKYFDVRYDDHYIGEKSYEKAELKMLQDAIGCCLKKVTKKYQNIDVFLGGDLNNQITSSNYMARDFRRPFIGLYSACSTVALALINASLLIDSKAIKNANVFVSSHNATAERQFRYPIEYGIQKKLTSTFTATGAVSVLLSNQRSKVRVESVTLGRVIDYKQKDPNDMGRAMAPCAYDTLMNHLRDLKRKGTYYDLILTGDLSNYGKSILTAMMENNIEYKEYNDCGCLLYDTNKQDVFQGGSGPTCSALVTFGYVYQMMLKGKYQRVLIIPTGALLSPVMTNQKESIPCIAHAFSLEVVK